MAVRPRGRGAVGTGATAVWRRSTAVVRLPGGPRATTAGSRYRLGTGFRADGFEAESAQQYSARRFAQHPRGDPESRPAARPDRDRRHAGRAVPRIGGPPG